MVIETTDEKIRKNQPKWMADNGDLKVVADLALNETKTVYTVPSGKVFYLVACGLGYSVPGSGPATGVANMKIAGNFFMGLRPGNYNSDNQTSISFPIPLKLTANQTLQVVSSRDEIAVSGWFTGYEFDA